MAHPQTAEAGDAPFDTLDDAAAALEGLGYGDEPAEVQETEGEDEGEPQDGELEVEPEEEEGEGDEPETAIEAPASLNADEKARFAQLPKEAQQMLAEVENRRNGQVQQATTKAAEAQRAAETRAAQADAQAKLVYAQQLKAVAERVAPQRPDPRLAQTDPTTFIALNAQYEAERAQHDEFMQQVTAMGQQASQDMSAAEVAERDRELMAIPEVADETTREQFFKKAIGAAEMLGLDMTQINFASARELKALRQIDDWKVKADKYDAAMSRQMQRVRESKKPVTTKPNAAQPQGSGRERAFREAQQRVRATGSLDDAAAAISRLP